MRAGGDMAGVIVAHGYTRGMKPSAPLNPARLDVAALAAAGHAIDGTMDLAELSRLGEEGASATGAHSAASPVTWSARGARRHVKGGDPQTLLHLQAQATVTRTCQRCLQPVALPLVVDRTFLFAPTEALAEEWDAHSEEDVLALTRALNLTELIEDELLLELPLVPRHVACQAPVSGSESGLAHAEPDLTQEAAPHPFAALAALRSKGGA